MQEDKVLGEIKKILNIQKQQQQEVQSLKSSMIKLETNHLPHIQKELEKLSNGQKRIEEDLDILTGYVKRLK